MTFADSDFVKRNKEVLILPHIPGAIRVSTPASRAAESRQRSASGRRSADSGVSRAGRSSLRAVLETEPQPRLASRSGVAGFSRPTSG